MAQVGKKDRAVLDRLITKSLEDHREPATPELVETLVDVALGQLMESLGHLPRVSRDFELGQLAPYIVGAYLQGTRPSPTNAYLGLLRNVANSYLKQKMPDPPVSEEVVIILATLGMGNTRETDPKPTRAGTVVKLVDLYVEGRGAP